MMSLLALPSVGTHVQKLKRKLEALLYHTYQRIERIANTHEDKQKLSQETRSSIRRFEELTQQPLQQNRDEEKSDSSNQSGDKSEKETSSSSYIKPKTIFPSSDALSSSEDNAKSLQPKKKLKNLNKNKKTSNKWQELAKKKRKNTVQLSTSEMDSSGEEVVEKICKRK